MTQVLARTTASSMARPQKKALAFKTVTMLLVVFTIVFFSCYNWGRVVQPVAKKSGDVAVNDDRMDSSTRSVTTNVMESSSGGMHADIDRAQVRSSGKGLKFSADAKDYLNTTDAVASYSKINIDIGTAGMTDGMTRGDTLLITFDPFDAPLKRKGHHRYPYVVGPIDGKVNFTVNHEYPQCSSLNKVNPNFKFSSQMCSLKTRRVTRMCAFPKKLETSLVSSIKLSSFLRSHNIREIESLKIDAQGSDFTILQDVLEITPKVSIKQFLLECQDLGRAGRGRRIYEADNDCRQIKNYMKHNRSEWSLFAVQCNNCEAEEWNLWYRNRTLAQTEQLPIMIPESQIIGTRPQLQ